MKKSELLTCCAASALLAAFMLASPRYMAGARSELTMRESAKREESFQGIIDVWHVVGFKPYQGSLGAWVSKRAARVEKKHKGVYFEVESISAEECTRRFERGERADVYSFPLGFAYAEQLAPLEYDLPQLRGNLAQVGDYTGRLFAVPYAASGYVLAVNTRLMQEAGTKADAVAEIIKSGQWRCAGSGILAAVYGAKGAALAQSEFIEERAEAAFIDARGVGDMARRIQAGKGFPYCEMRFSNFSDLVQLVGVSRETEAEKLTYINELIAEALSEEAQLSLYELGLIPARIAALQQKPENETTELLALELEGIAAPNAFLYKTYRDQLELSAAGLLEGDAGAKKDFDLRLIELVRGAVIK